MFGLHIVFSNYHIIITLFFERHHHTIKIILILSYYKPNTIDSKIGYTRIIDWQKLSSNCKNNSPFILDGCIDYRINTQNIFIEIRYVRDDYTSKFKDNLSHNAIDYDDDSLPSIEHSLPSIEQCSLPSQNNKRKKMNMKNKRNIINKI